jgi:hypothetical protein
MKVDANIELRALQTKALAKDVLKEQIKLLSDEPDKDTRAGSEASEHENRESRRVIIDELDYALNDLKSGSDTNQYAHNNNVLATKTSKLVAILFL